MESSFNNSRSLKSLDTTRGKPEREKKSKRKLIARYFLYFFLCFVALVAGSENDTEPTYTLDERTIKSMSQDIYLLIESSTDVHIAKVLSHVGPRFKSGEYKYQCSDHVSCFFHAIRTSTLKTAALSNLVIRDVIRPLDKCIRAFDNPSIKFTNALPPCLYDLEIGERFVKANKNQFNAQFSEASVRQELIDVRQKLGDIQQGGRRDWMGFTVQRELNQLYDNVNGLRAMVNNYGIICDTTKITENFYECGVQLNLTINKISNNLDDLDASIDSTSSDSDFSKKRSPSSTLIRSLILALLLTFLLAGVNFLFGISAAKISLMSYLGL